MKYGDKPVEELTRDELLQLVKAMQAHQDLLYRLLNEQSARAWMAEVSKDGATV